MFLENLGGVGKAQGEKDTLPAGNGISGLEQLIGRIQDMAQTETPAGEAIVLVLVEAGLL